MSREEWFELFRRARDLADKDDLLYEDSVLIEIERAGYKLVKEIAP